MAAHADDGPVLIVDAGKAQAHALGLVHGMFCGAEADRAIIGAPAPAIMVADDHAHSAMMAADIEGVRLRRRTGQRTDPESRRGGRGLDDVQHDISPRPKFELSPKRWPENAPRWLNGAGTARS